MSLFKPPKLGVGMIFSPALRPWLERRFKAATPNAPFLDVLEIEPQTLWLADDAFVGPFYEFGPGIELFRSLPGAKLVHSVSLPLGGTRTPNPVQCALIRDTAKRLESPWVSEHLSVGGTPHHASGFFLPPLQTNEGVEIAVRNIRDFAEAVELPVAVETGVAYLARKDFEMADGDFVAEVVSQADCGILLDLHNVYCNARNGRFRMDEFLASLPMERVWEVHLAGGMEQSGFWLDAHSGPIPSDLKAIAREVLADLPNLGALNFEIYDSFVEQTGEDALDRTIDELRDLWSGVGRSVSDASPMTLSPAIPKDASSDPELWEAALTEAVWKAQPEAHPHPEDDAAIALYAKLARSFRGSMLARTLPRAVRYLILRESKAVEAILSRYFEDVSPRLYAPLEAAAFAEWISASGDDDRLLQGLLDYDLALLQTLRDGKPHIVRFPGNPAPVFEALAERRLPTCPEPPEWELELLPDLPGIVPV